MTRRAVLEHTKIHYCLGAGTEYSLIIIIARVATGSSEVGEEALVRPFR